MDIQLLKKKVAHVWALPGKLVHLNWLALKQFLTGRRQYLKRTEATFMGDDFATVHYVPFLHQETFCDAYKKAFIDVDKRVEQSIKKLDISWRFHICTWAASQAINLDGDFVECGVWWGLLSKGICEYVSFDRQRTKNFYLFDTWGDPSHARANHSNYQVDIFDEVSKRFASYDNVHLLRGHVPDVLSTVSIERIAYLSIDMNGAKAERQTLEKFYDKVVPGGIIYFDDYGWNYPELRKEVDEFLNDKPETLLHFPSGNSILIKV
jgi:O-methyltransferase